MTHEFASPHRFAAIARAALPVAAIAAALLLGLGLWLALGHSPADYQQGDFVRIMYVHVPAAWLAMGIYSAMVASSIAWLIWRHPIADMIARNSAPIGTVFCGICLLTGMIWARPMWGAWWVWDARLTSMLVLFFIYVGYLLLAKAADDAEKSAMPLACLALVGGVNLPIIKFSVEWWNSLHQPASVFRSGGSSLHPDMLAPLMVMGLAFLLIYIALLLAAVQTELWERKYKRAMRKLQRSV